MADVFYAKKTKLMWNNWNKNGLSQKIPVVEDASPYNNAVVRRWARA